MTAESSSALSPDARTAYPSDRPRHDAGPARAGQPRRGRPAAGGRRRPRPPPARPPGPAERVALAGLLVATALLYLWGLGASGWANTFYSAAAQAGSESWKAFFFGSSDAANSITVDKTPLACGRWGCRCGSSGS